MRVGIGAVVVMTMGTCGVWAAQMATVEILCPVDKHSFTVPVVSRVDASAGTDSDFCGHSTGVSNVPYMIVTCPRCNYTALRDKFGEEVKDETGQKILEALATSAYRGVENPFTEVPLWERAKLGDRCAQIKGEPASERVDLFLLGVYGLRLEATKAVDRLYGFGGPVEMELLMKAVERAMREERDKGEQAARKANLAMIAERAGLTRERDEWIARARADAALGEASKRELERFTKLIGLERTSQEELAGIIGEAMKEEVTTADRRNFLRYLKADTLRRLGRTTEALAEFKAVREAMAQTGSVRDLCDHFIKLLEEKGEKQ